MEISSATRTAIKLAGSWGLAACLAWAVVVNFDEVRDTLGLKLEPRDFARQTEAVQREPEVRTVIKYVERPANPREQPAAVNPGRRAPAISSTATVELHSGRGGHFETEAFINGRGVRVLVDTGATTVALTYEDAMAAGISVADSDFRHFTQTANGRGRIAHVRLDDVRIGDITVRNVQASVLEQGKLSVTLLGMSFLGRLSRAEMSRGMLILQE